jgi:hypothetical protein
MNDSHCRSHQPALIISHSQAANLAYRKKQIRRSANVSAHKTRYVTILLGHFSHFVCKTFDRFTSK